VVAKSVATGASPVTRSERSEPSQLENREGQGFTRAERRVPHFSRVLCARSGAFRRCRYAPFNSRSITFRSASLILV
jgi:hypothetical protein